MSTGPKPRESVIWNGEKSRFDWSVTLPDGREITGYAVTEYQAHRDMHNDWRVRGGQPRYVERMPRGGIESPAAP